MLFTGLVAFPVIALIGIAYDFHSRLRSKRHTLRSALKQYLIVSVSRLFHGYIRKQLNKATKDVKSVQETFLLQSLLKDSAETTYGKFYDFGSIRSREEYRRVHSLTK